MLISLCVPCHKRTADLVVALPTWIQAANASPPVEIAVLDYNSQDDVLHECLDVLERMPLKYDNEFSYRHYAGREHYHMAHARNLSVRMSRGEYIMIASADILLKDNTFTFIREQLESGNDWIVFKYFEGVTVMKRTEFMGAGGYDERFEFYGPEDQDLRDRFERRGNKKTLVHNECVSVIQTKDEDKVRNYRLPLTKKNMANLMHPIYWSNIEKGTLVANEGVEWGDWWI